jgi:DNA-binding transcriptional regulator GbsR (MarR family)
MTEMTDIHKTIPPALERFVVHWGEMGEKWGVNRSVAQIHALLFVTDRPMTADDIAGQLGLARSNVSTSLKELQGWTLVKRVQVLGDRRDYFEAEADMFEMVRRIAIGRKARELDPTLDVLRTCASDAAKDSRVSVPARRRLNDMLQFMEVVDKSFDEVIRLPAPTLSKLMKMGGTLARFVGRGNKALLKRG